MVHLGQQSYHPGSQHHPETVWKSKSNAWGLRRWYSGKELACQGRNRRRCRFYPWVRKLPWSRKWQPIPVFFPGKFHGQRSLVGYSSWTWKGLDTNEHTAHTHKYFRPNRVGQKSWYNLSWVAQKGNSGRRYSGSSPNLGKGLHSNVGGERETGHKGKGPEKWRWNQDGAGPWDSGEKKASRFWITLCKGWRNLNQEKASGLWHQTSHWDLRFEQKIQSNGGERN